MEAKVNEPLCVSIPEAGRRAFGVGRVRAYELAQTGVIPTIRLGPRRLMVPVAALNRLADQAVQEAEARRAAADDTA